MDFNSTETIGEIERAEREWSMYNHDARMALLSTEMDDDDRAEYYREKAIDDQITGDDY